MRRALQQILSGRPQSLPEGDALEAPALPHARTARDGSARLLVVDDSETNRIVMRGMLSALGYEVDEANDGEQGLAAFKGEQRYAAILMDCQMPVMDGYTAARLIRECESSTGRAAIPIIAVTAHAMSEERERVLKIGMNDYLTKPVRMGVLAETLERWTRVRQEAVTRELVCAPENDNDTALDPNVLASLRGMVSPQRPDFMKNVAQRYIDEGRDSVQVLRSALSDAELLRAGAHKLKGASRLIGAMILGEQCEQLEELASLGDMAAAKSLFDDIEREFVRVCSELETAVA